MNPTIRIRFGIAALMFFAAVRSPAAPAVSNGLPSPAHLQEMIVQIAAQGALEPEPKVAMADSLRAAVGFAGQAAGDAVAIETLPREAADLEKTLASLRGEQKQLLDSDTLEVPPSDLAELETWILRQQVHLGLAIERRDAAEQELVRLRTRPDAIQQDIEHNRRTLSALPPGEIPEWTEPTPEVAAAIRTQWEREALELRSRRLEVELDTLDSRQQIAAEESRTALLQVERLQARLDAARKRLSRGRIVQMLETSSNVRETKQSLEGASPHLLQIAEQNVLLADVLAGDAADAHELNQALVQGQAQRERVRQALEWVTEILAIDNLPAAYSEQLRTERQKLTWIRQVEQGARKRQQKVALKRIGQLEVREAFRNLAEMESIAAGKSSGPDGLTKSDRAKEQALLATQRKLLEERERMLNEYHSIRGKLDLVEAEQIRDGHTILQVLNSRLLWTRSMEGVGSDWFREQRLNVQALISEHIRYFGTASDRWDLLRHQKGLWLAGLLLIALAFQLAPRMRKRIRLLAEQTDRLLTDRFAYTMEALAWTVALAAMGPLVLLYGGWLLTGGVTGELLQGAGYGLMHASWVLFGCTFLRCLCRPFGVAKVHFRWPETTSKTLFRSAGRAQWIYPPLTAFTLLCLWNGEDWLRSGPGRMGMLVLLASLAWSVHRLFRNKGGLLQEWLVGSSALLQRLVPFCRFAMVSALLVLGVAAVRGYLYTVRIMLLQLVALAAVLMAAVLVFNLALRWLRIARRRYAIAQIRQRRKESKTADPEAAEGEGAGIQLKDLEAYDVDQLNDQTRRMVRLAVICTTVLVLLGLFRPLLPALGFFDSITLWQQDDGSRITLRSGLLSLLAVFLTAAAARNIPGLLEMALLPLAPLKSSSRFAIVTLSRYGILLAGIIVAFGAVGIGWSQIQWLAAAITVGLGFGLQEIFANFVSGIILLFEQPIRVGDVVTVGDTTGIVSRIQMRATTITDWDRKELVVPNKEFISGRLLNWTLSDNVTRVLIHVGVAYGSNVRLALEVLAKVAAQNPTVLKDPKPAVNFEAFGDSTLDLTLRAYLPSLDNRLATTTELLTGIDDAFRAAGIEIAFPQRDLHVRSVDPGVARFLGAMSPRGGPKAPAP